MAINMTENIAHARNKRKLGQGVLKGGEGGTISPIFGTTKRSVFSTNAQSRFASFVLDTVLGPPRLALHT